VCCLFVGFVMNTGMRCVFYEPVPCFFFYMYIRFPFVFLSQPKISLNFCRGVGQGALKERSFTFCPVATFTRG
jgi:hypothetical protein